MLRNLFAFVFLVLAVSPFTAPFQTYTESRIVAVAPLGNENNVALIAPLVTKGCRLTIVVPTGLSKSSFVLIAFRIPVSASPSHGTPVSTRLTVLRL